jgi:hypothetical protein
MVSVSSQYFYELEVGPCPLRLIDTNAPAVTYWHFTGAC